MDAEIRAAIGDGKILKPDDLPRDRHGGPLWPRLCRPTARNRSGTVQSCERISVLPLNQPEG
ncbi:hypothetical protein [Actinomadura macra]|uniref:hypothetical protein n=1 Tax=Actinomadura macra TaxID=46164 RepID=UPI0012F9E615|nr:hypothetical protein [Actinomadura macra]